MRNAIARRRGFTLIELLVVISIIALLIGILLPALGRARRQARVLRDSAQLKQVHLAFTIYANSNDENFPYPYNVDFDGNTEGPKIAPGQDPPSAAWDKNRTGPIFSILIYNGNLSPEVLRGPNEPNTNIQPDDDFLSGRISKQVRKCVQEEDRVAWDPGFMGTPSDLDKSWKDCQPNTGAGQIAIGNNSYAHIPIIGRRLRFWQNTFGDNDAVLSNRGPIYVQSAGGGGGGDKDVELDTPSDGQWILANSPSGTESDTLTLGGSTSSWAGNIAFNDNHVAFSDAPDPLQLTFSDTRVIGTPQSPRPVRDNIFVDERNENPDALLRRNFWMRIWYKGLDPDLATSHGKLAESIWFDGCKGCG